MNPEAGCAWKHESQSNKNVAMSKVVKPDLVTSIG